MQSSLGKLRREIVPTQNEVKLAHNDVIVSKTDLKGYIQYANRVFIAISGYNEAELLGQPHAILRHPDMPRAAFKLLWDRLHKGKEVFAYVKNLCRNGDFYWVLAHVTPTFGGADQIIGYHSNRRAPYPLAIREAEALYAEILAVEAQHANGKEALAAGERALNEALRGAGKSYDEFVFDLTERAMAA